MIVGRLLRRSDIVAVLLCLAVFAVAIVLGARSASGSDSFGYVSQAYLWRDGSLRIEQPLLHDVPWPYPAESLTPLAYQPHGGRLVPVVPPGIPLLMAGLLVLFGACGPFLLAPIAGAALVGATYGLAARLAPDRRVALIAAALTATSPAFLVNVVLPMSDTTTAALWTLALCALTFDGWRAAAIAGLLSGVAVLARPNLAPAAIALVAAAELWRGPHERRFRRAVLVIACGALPAALFVLMLNRSLYGSPWLSGYGSAADLYSASYIWRNVRQYSIWLWRSEAIAVALVALAIVARPVPVANRRVLWPLGIFGAIVVASYLAYAPFDAWWYLRFLLPAFPLLFVTAAAVTAWLLDSFGGGRRVIVLATVLGLAILRILPYRTQILNVAAGEDRSAAVAQFIVSGLPANAVFVTSQHSGTIRFYAGRMTVRYEWFAAPRFAHALAWLQQRGYRPYIVLENWEEPHFRRKLSDAGPVGRLELRVVAQFTGPAGVRIYDPFDSAVTARPFEIVARHGSCARPALSWRRPLAESIACTP